MLISTSTPLNNIISSNHQLILTPMHNRYEIISEIIKNIIHFTHFLRLYNESLSKYPIFKCNNSSQWEIGSEFTLLIEEHIQIHFRLKTLIETDYYMHVEYFAYKTEPESFQYSFIITQICKKIKHTKRCAQSFLIQQNLIQQALQVRQLLFLRQRHQQ